MQANKHTDTLVDKTLNRVSRFLTWVSMGALCGIVLIVCANVIARTLGRPIAGTYELVGFLGAVVIAFALVYNARSDGNIKVDLLLSWFSDRVRSRFDILTNLFNLGLCFFVFWAGMVQANEWRKSGQLSQTLQLPTVHLLAYGIAFCFLILCIVLLLDILRAVEKARSK